MKVLWISFIRETANIYRIKREILAAQEAAKQEAAKQTRTGKPGEGALTGASNGMQNEKWGKGQLTKQAENWIKSN